MDSVKLGKVRKVSMAFRGAIIQAKSHLELLSLRDFPLGSCGDASLLLSRFLEEAGLDGAVYAYGLRETHTHGWLELENLIVDITADQFANDPEAVLQLGPPPKSPDGVILTTEFGWHSQFEDVRRSPARIDVYDEVTKRLLEGAYREICSKLKSLY